MVLDQDADPAGAVVHPLGGNDDLWVDPKNGSDLVHIGVIHWSASNERRCRKGEPLIVSQLDQADPAFLDDEVAPGGATGAQPGVAAPQSRMSGEGKFSQESEDPHPIVGISTTRRKKEGRFREVQPPGDRQHLICAQSVGAMHHGERITRESTRPEYVDHLKSPTHRTEPRQRIYADLERSMY